MAGFVCRRPLTVGMRVDVRVSVFVAMVLAGSVRVLMLVGVIMVMAVAVIVSVVMVAGINARRALSGQSASAIFTH